MLKTIPAVIVLIIISGCQTKIGPFAIAGLGVQYQHIEYDSDGEKLWETNAFRSWGTSRFNVFIDEKSEKIGIEGEGISERMAGVVKVIGSKALCAVPAIAPSCVTGAFKSGPNMSNEQAVDEFKNFQEE